MIIPCYNEALTIGKVVEDFRRELPEASVYVYDNNSTDGTAEIANGSGAIVRNEPRQDLIAGEPCVNLAEIPSNTSL